MSLFAHTLARGPLALIEGQPYVPDGRPSTQVNGDCLIMGDEPDALRFPLTRVDVPSLWTVYGRNKADNLEAAIEERAKSRLSGSGDKALASLLGAPPEYVSLTRFVLFDVFPHLLGSSADEQTAVLAGTAPPGKAAILPTLTSLFGKDPVDLTRTVDLPAGPAQTFEQTYLHTLRGRTRTSDMLALGFRAPTYRLEAAATGAPARLAAEAAVVVAGRTYIPTRQVDFNPATLDEAFARHFDHLVDIGFAARLRELVGKDSDTYGVLAAALKQRSTNRSFEAASAGLVFQTKSITVYVKVPPYALRDWLAQRGIDDERPRPGSHPLYYVFPESKVAVNVETNLRRSSAYLMGPSQSPFISSGHGHNLAICTGNLASAPYAEALAKLPEGLRVAKYLQDAAGIITSGYTSNCHPYIHLGQAFSPATIEEITRRGIPITNEPSEARR